jgi:tetratricopeptide (TPR) repeat protein
MLPSTARGSTKNKLVKKTALLVIWPILAFCLLTGCARDTAKARFEAAEVLLGNGEFERAIEEYRYVVDTFGATPYGSGALYKIAIIYDRHMQDRPGSIEAYYTLYNIYPESAEAVLAREDMALIYSEAGNHSKAVGEYQWVLERSPGKETHYRYLIAMEYLKMNDFRQTRLELRDLLESLEAEDPLPTPSTPGHEFIVEIYFKMANTYYLEGRNQTALKAYDELVERFPDHALGLEARLNKAHILVEDERFEAALEVLDALLDEYPNKETISAMIKLTKKRLRESPDPRKRWRR